MRKKKWIFVVAPFAMAAFIVIGGEVVKYLWNWLLPDLFGWRQITFWQAWGLLALCRILFGGVGVHGNSRSHGRRRASERWEKLSPEERERFRQFIRTRPGDGPAEEPGNA